MTDVEEQIGEHLQALAELFRVVRGRCRDGGRPTELELEVAALAAAGLSNRHIAARLRLSEDAVKGRLKTTFAKLGVASRVQLGPALAGLGDVA